MTSATGADTPAGSWDGEPGRWPRPRHARVPGRGAGPSCFVQADPADPLSAATERLQQCFTEFLCQVCGDAITDGERGWVLEPAANMGGACCTRCMHMAVRFCPHLSGVPDGDFTMWEVTEREAYAWHLVDGRAKGHVVPVSERGVARTWIEFLEAVRATRVKRS